MGVLLIVVVKSVLIAVVKSVLLITVVRVCISLLLRPGTRAPVVDQIPPRVQEVAAP
jgi:hypothetical protein